MASLVVPCPCGTKLAAPESAVGKQIRCPKCGALTTVPAMLPAEEVKVVDAKVAETKPKPKPVRAEAADDDEDDRPRKRKVRAAAVDDDDEEDDRPRKKNRPRYADDDDDYAHDRPKRKKPKRKSAGGALVAGLIVGGLLLVCVGVGVAVALFSSKGSILAKKAPVPPGWEQYTYPQDGFKLYAPKGANYVTTPVDGFGPFGRRRPDRGGGMWNADLPVAERAAVITAGAGGPVQVNMYVFRFRDRVPAAVLDEFRNGRGERRIDDLHTRPITWLGYAAEEEVQAHVVTRMVLTDRLLMLASIAGPNGGRAKPEEEAAFFDHIELTN